MTTPNSVREQEREAFEAWRRQTTKMNPDDAVALEGFGDDAPYANKITRVMHIAWKAAWQARATLSTRVEGTEQFLPLYSTRAKARRYDWLKARLLCADFEYGDPSEACSALVFKIPDGMEVSADLDSTIDSAEGLSQ